MSIDALRTELTDDPLGIGYSSMTAKQVRASLYAETRTEPIDSVTGQQIFEAVVPAHYDALDAANKQLFLGIVGMGTIAVGGTNTKARLAAMFTGATDTLDALVALQTRPVSRAVELKLGPIALSDIDKARA